MKNKLQKIGKFLSGMVMPNIGAFIAWGLITALFIPEGWFPNADLAGLVGPILTYLLPILIGYQGGKIVGGDRGAVTGAIATMGVVVGADQAMLIGAMVIGPASGFVIKKFDELTKDRVKAGFEMIVNNFSVGIIGMILAILGYYLVGPVMVTILTLLSGGVAWLIQNSLLPLVSIFVEPAKVLFLNNAINHGIFTPLGTKEVVEAGRSIMYMIESNPGPGLGVLLACMMFAKDKVTKSSAPGAAVIHFFGGIHEIYFPYILMNPILIIAPIAASAAAVAYYSIMGSGLVAPPAPGSILAYLAVAPRGETLSVFIGVAIATAVSFLVAAPILKMSKSKSLDEASKQMNEMKASAKGLDVNIKGMKLNKIVFACDAGMGSSAMGATKFRNSIKDINKDIIVINTSVDNVPEDADVVVCQAVLKDRVKVNAKVITIGNFLADSNLDLLRNEIKSQVEGNKEEVVVKEEAPKVVENKVEENDEPGLDIIVAEGIKTGLESVSKEDAIKEAGRLLVNLGCVNEGYIDAMLEREKVVSTYMGLGVAIPHGTNEGKKEINKVGVVLLQYPEGIDFGDEKAYLLFGIAGVGDKHISLLSKIATVIEDSEKLEMLKNAKTSQEVLRILGTEEVEIVEAVVEEVENDEPGLDIIVAEGIKTGLTSVSKDDAIKEAGRLLVNLGCVNEGYIDAMLDREKVVSTYMGLGVAIPHGTNEGKKEINKVGVVLLQYPEGIDFGDEKAYLLFGIAGVGDKHISLLSKIATVIEDSDKLEMLKKAKTSEEVLKILQ